MSERAFFIDHSRCIRCGTCMATCSARVPHMGLSMIYVTMPHSFVQGKFSPQICMHCENPACVRVCPTNAIEVTADGVVLSPDKRLCGDCSLCVNACPFKVPLYVESLNRTMKCDLCNDRSSTGRTPMCAAVCPSGALTYATMGEILRIRHTMPVNAWRFGDEAVRTKVYVLPPSSKEDEFDARELPGPFEAECPVSPFLETANNEMSLTLDVGATQ